MQPNTKKQLAICISCDAEFRIPGTPKKGQLVYCHKCEAELEIVSLNPLTLDWPFYDMDEDMDEYDDYDDDDDDYDDDYDDD